MHTTRALCMQCMQQPQIQSLFHTHQVRDVPECGGLFHVLQLYVGYKPSRRPRWSNPSCTHPTSTIFHQLGTTGRYAGSVGSVSCDECPVAKFAATVGTTVSEGGGGHERRPTMRSEGGVTDRPFPHSPHDLLPPLLLSQLLVYLVSGMVVCVMDPTTCNMAVVVFVRRSVEVAPASPSPSPPPALRAPPPQSAS